MSERGWRVSLVAGGPVGDNPYATHAGGGTYAQYLRGPLNYRRHLRTADVVVDVANGMVAFTPLWRKGATICLVHHVHTEQWSTALPAPLAEVGRTLESRGMPAVYRNSLFIAVSPSTKAALTDLGVPADRIRIVPNGVELPKASELKTPPNATPLFVSVGRLVPHKRHELLLRAWRRVHAVTGGELVIIGDGPLAPTLEQLAGPGVRMVGHVSDAERDDLIDRSWFNVHPAAHEGWGLVILEAAARRRATLAFDVPGVRDAIVHGQTGELARDEDDLVERWIALASDPCLRDRYGVAARRHAADYSWERTVERFEEVVREALAVSEATPAPRARSVHRAPDQETWPRTELSFVIPAYNEERRIDRTLTQLAKAVPLCDTEVIVVDDGSTDATSEIAAEALAAFPNHQIVRLETNSGKGAAVRAGVQASRGNRIVMMDADLATDLECLPPLLDALAHADVAVGSRSLPNSVTRRHATHRAVMGRTFNRVIRSATTLDHLDTQCGFKSFRAPVAALLFGMSRQEGFAFDVEVLLCARRLGLKVSEVPVRWTAVDGSKVRVARDSLRMLRDVYDTTSAPPRGSFGAIRFPCVQDRERDAKLVRSFVRASDVVVLRESTLDVLLAWDEGVGRDLVRARLERVLRRDADTVYEATGPTVIDLVSTGSLISG